MRKRAALADFWDENFRIWFAGDDAIPIHLRQWAGAYQGKGTGAVDLTHYPDPCVGDLRGTTYKPRIVLLGLNPGIGFDTLQSREGVWAQRIHLESYSACFARSPAEDPVEWNRARGSSSKYWASAIRFAQRWLTDQSVGVHDIINFELYPWHSKNKTAAMRVPAAIANDFVFDPISEFEIDIIFAFGADWFEVADRLGLKILRRFTSDELRSTPSEGWRVSAFQMAGGQRLVVSSQAGYAGPPGETRLGILRTLLR